MSDNQGQQVDVDKSTSNELDSSNTLSTFRKISEDDLSYEESSDESSCDGALKAAYSYDDMLEELENNNGNTLCREDGNVAGDVVYPGDETIYENLRFGAVGPHAQSYDGNDDYGWSSSEFDDSDEPMEEQGKNVAMSSFDIFLRRKKKLKSQMSSIIQEQKLRMSKEFRKYKKKSSSDSGQTSMLDKIAKLGHWKPKQEEIPTHPDPDLEPLNFGVGNKEFKPACLPALLPEDLTPIQNKRRQIVEAVIESERSYLLSLKRLIEEYQVPLVQAQPQIINPKHVKVIFYKITDIIQCHLLFHGELYNMADKWDEDEKIGDIFIASFSKSTVFDAYSSFVNNFPAAMERAKKQARIKTAFNSFLKNKLDTSKDKLSLFGLMVKPVQRFPQFILFIQDLLKNTPKDHTDRLSLQLALTELEMLTDRLNETKRECESRMEAKRLSEILHFGSTKLDPSSLFIRQDEVIQHKTRDGETISKPRRLFLLSDQLICASAVKQKDSLDPSQSSSAPLFASNEKLVVSWNVPIKDVEIVDPTLPSYKGNPLSRPSFSPSSSSSSSSSSAPNQKKNQERQGRQLSSMPPKTNPYWKELNSMLQDLKIFENMLDLYSQLKLKYDALPMESIKGPIASLEMLIRQKFDVDKKIVTLSVPTSRGRKSVSLEFLSLTMKHDWLIELQSAKLATDPRNFPAWYLSENDPLSNKNPRFMTALKMDIITKEEKRLTLKPKKKTKDELTCCTYITLPCNNKPGAGIRHLWVCIGGRAAIVSLHTNQPFVMECFNICESNILVAECIPGPSPWSDPYAEVKEGRGHRGMGSGEVVWMVSEDNKLYIAPAIQGERQQVNKTIKVEGGRIRCMKYLNNKVYLGTCSGLLLVYSRCSKGNWNFTSPQKLTLGQDIVTCFMVADDNTLWASCASSIHIIDGQWCPTNPDLSTVYMKAAHVLLTDNTFVTCNSTTAKTTTATNSSTIECMVKAGVGLLVSFRDQSTIRLYHIETFQHLQDISISSAVAQLLEEKNTSMKTDHTPSTLSITCMLPDKGVLYIGTNQGFVFTLPLPRLNGMPKFRQRPAISFQSHVGAVKFLASIQCSLIERDHEKSNDLPKVSNKELIESIGSTNLAPDADKSDKVSTDTLIGDDQLAPPSQGNKRPIASQNGDLNNIVYPSSFGSLSSSTPDLLNIQLDLKDQQMNGLYESLLRGITEDGDDEGVLQRIASTPLPHRRKHRLSNLMQKTFISGKKLVAMTTTPTTAANQEVPGCEMRAGSRQHRQVRHSSAELLGRGSSNMSSIRLMRLSESFEEEIREEEERKRSPSVRVDAFKDEDGEDRVRTQILVTDESGSSSIKDKADPDHTSKIISDIENVDESSVTNNQDDGDATDERKETLEEANEATSHLKKSASSASDTPSQKSSSSTSSTMTNQTQSQPVVSETKFSAYTRYSIPSNTAMISSNLTTTPKSRATVFASAGLGNISWNSLQKLDTSPDKPFLLLWMC